MSSSRRNMNLDVQAVSAWGVIGYWDGNYWRRYGAASSLHIVEIIVAVAGCGWLLVAGGFRLLAGKNLKVTT